MWSTTIFHPADNSCAFIRRGRSIFLRFTCPVRSVMCSAIFGKSIPRGPMGRYPRCSIDSPGMPIGKEACIRTRRLRLGSVGSREFQRKRGWKHCSRAEGISMLRVAIIGCGKIADSHAEQIQHIEDCEIVGVCDQEELMAKQLYERFPIKAFFSNVEELLEKARPDVVHITTP